MVSAPNSEKSIRNTILLFVSLQIYFASNTLSFGFWKSTEYVFEYMLLFYGVWLVAIVLLLTLILLICRRFENKWIALIALVFLSVPFAYDLWVWSFEIESRTARYVVRIIILPLVYLYFRLGLSQLRIAVGGVFLLCTVSFFGHAGPIFAIDRTHDFESIELSRKPNIHIVMLDAFTHSSFTSEFMGLSNPAAEFLKDRHDAIFAGTLGFSERDFTTGAWGTLFNLANGDWTSHVMSGMKPSRLAMLLRENGYTITTGYSDGYFGWQQGEWVDYYHRGGSFHSLRSDLACISDKGKLGLCEKLSQSIFSKLFIDDTVDRNKWNRDWPDKVIEYIDNDERSKSGPLFSAYHIYVPGHTPTDFVTGNEEMFQEFRTQYAKGLDEAKVIVKKIDQLRQRYPHSIFIIAGDHGPILSRTAPKSESRFLLLDGHAIALSMLNISNLCPWSKKWLDEQQYLTPSRMLVAALVCDNRSRQLTEHFVDNEEFIRFGKSFEVK